MKLQKESSITIGTKVPEANPIKGTQRALFAYFKMNMEVSI